MSNGISFSVADVPVDSAPSDNGPSEIASDESTERSCEVCGTALSYSGRGRPPTRCADHKKGTSNSSGNTRASTGRKSSRDVEAAMAALDAAHTSLTFGLMLLSPIAAAEWEGNRPNLNARNQMILESDPALAKRISSMAAKGGTTALVLNHLIAIVPVLGIVRQEARERSAAKRAAREETIMSDQADIPFNFGGEAS